MFSTVVEPRETMFSTVVAYGHVILSLSKDGHATQGYLTPTLRQAQDDMVAARDDRAFGVACLIVDRFENRI
jgi:hypothetical protein